MYCKGTKNSLFFVPLHHNFKASIMMHILDFRVDSSERLSGAYGLLKLSPCTGALPQGIVPGQFVQVKVDNSPTTYLRRPISVCMADYEAGQIWLLVRDAGAGTRHMIEAKEGDVFNIVLPLGNGFSLDSRSGSILLVGGGVGVAPLLYLGKVLKENGMQPEFALGARSASDLLLLDEFAKYGPVHLTTEDGSRGEKGFIINHSRFNNEISHIACCGPTPMMKAVAKIAKQRGICCEVSLENMMACGVGACLCCVEDTADEGNVCVCKEGPVFNANRLKWEL